MSSELRNPGKEKMFVLRVLSSKTRAGDVLGLAVTVVTSFKSIYVGRKIISFAYFTSL